MRLLFVLTLGLSAFHAAYGETEVRSFLLTRSLCSGMPDVSVPLDVEQSAQLREMLSKVSKSVAKEIVLPASPSAAQFYMLREIVSDAAPTPPSEPLPIKKLPGLDAPGKSPGTTFTGTSVSLIFVGDQVAIDVNTHAQRVPSHQDDLGLKAFLSKICSEGCPRFKTEHSCGCPL